MKIDFCPMKLDYGGPEEVATFGQLIITHGDFCLTRGVSQIDGEDAYLEGPHISSCLLAEWMAWNWWRLRWESFPQGPATDSWNFAHCMSSIGGGYTWPNIAIASDGFRCEMTSTASREPHLLSYQYIDPTPPGKLTFPASDFERECAAFVEHTLDLCNAADLHDTDLAQIWQELNAERSDPELCSLRRLEALLGRDPGELDQTELAEWRQDAEILGRQAVEELAIDAGQSSSGVISRLSAQKVAARTQSEGVEIRSSDAVAAHLPANSWGSSTPAWRLGVDLAKVIRHQAGLGLDPIGNDRLAELAGMAAKALTTPRSGAQDFGSVSWTFRQNREERIVFRSWRDTSRRFDVARLVADRLFSMDQFDSEEAMLPATRTHSYRQKAQRAFAGELLCPWLAVVERLGNDDSQEDQQQVADEFGVSPMVIDIKIRSNVDVYDDVAAMV